MGKTIGIIGNIVNPQVQQFIANEVSLLRNETLDFNQLHHDLDIFYIQPIDDKISSEMISEYSQNLAQTSFNSGFKVGIIQEFDLVSAQNQNKLLKIVEDNLDNTLQIFIFQNQNRILKTIISRIIIFDLASHQQLELTTEQQQESFYLEIVKNDLEYQYLADNPQSEATLKKVYHLLLGAENKRAFLLYSTLITELTGLNTQMLVRMLLVATYYHKRYSVLQSLIEYEQKFNYQVNKKLQLDSMFIEIQKGEE